MEKFRWLYVGSGNIAKSTARSIEKGNHSISAVYSRNYEKAKTFADKRGAKVYRDFNAALSDGEFDAVYIATPHTSHLEYSVKALNAGKPVLCEKPVGVSAEEAQLMIKAAKDNNAYFCEAMWTWFSDVALTVKKWVAEKRLGEIKSVHIDYSFPGLLEKISCSGTLKNGIDIAETVILSYDGFDCTLDISLTKLKEGCTIKGTKGEINIPMFHMGYLAELKADGKKEKFRGKTDYLTEFTAVASEIKDGLTESEIIPYSSTLNCLKILDECRSQLGLIYPFEKK